MKEFYKQYANDLNSNVPLNVLSPSDILRERYQNCEKCTLHENRAGVAFGYGAMRPKIMFIGFKPSNYDCGLGIPFSDKVGRKIYKVIEYLGRELNLNSNVYFTNLLLCNGDATEKEIDVCKERLEEEIKMVNPRNIVLLGEKVSQILLDKKGLGEKHVLKLNKYYDTFVIHDMPEIFYTRDNVKNELKSYLDDIVKELE